MDNDTTRRDFLKVSLAGAVGAALGTRPLHAAAAVDVNARLAVCSWSLQPSSADDLFTKLAATGVSRIQIALDPIRRTRRARRRTSPPARRAAASAASRA